MKKNKIIIIDFSHLAYRAYYKFPNLKNFDGELTSIIYGIPYIIESLIRKSMPDKAIVVLDGGRSKVRTNLLPTYKQREKRLGFDHDNFVFQKSEAQKFLLSLGVDVIYEQGEEADDLIYLATRRFSQMGWQVVIMSGDKDFNQLIKEDVSVFNTSKGKEYSMDTLKEGVGYYPYQCVDYLCLIGDKSDNIPGYPSIGEKRGISFLEKFNSIEGFLSSTEKFGSIDKTKLKEIKSFNRQLIDLNYYFRKHYTMNKEIPWLRAKWDIEKFKKLCGRYETNSFLQPQFINTYKNLYEKSQNIYYRG